MEAQLMQELFLVNSAQLEEKPKQRRMHIDDSLKKPVNFPWVAT
jgi:hypothetical protein